MHVSIIQKKGRQKRKSEIEDGKGIHIRNLLENLVALTNINLGPKVSQKLIIFHQVLFKGTGSVT